MTEPAADLPGTRLDAATYLTHLEQESTRFREAAAAAQGDAAVPSCPAWDLDDLVWHLTQVQSSWARTVTERPAHDPPAPTPERPVHRDALVAASEAASRALVTALDGVPVSDEAWTWHDTDQTVGFILRRQVHEALVHRLDAEQAASTPTPVDPELAADCVAECLEAIYGGLPDWGHWEGLPAHVLVECADTDDQVWVQLGRLAGRDPANGEEVDEEDLHVVADPGHEPDAVIEGTAADLAAWLWDRGDADLLATTGDRAVLDRLRTIVSQPIN